MDNRRLFLAALLSLAVLILWQVIFLSAPPPASRPQEGMPAETRAAEPSAAPQPTSPPLVEAAAEGPPAAPEQGPPIASESEERTVVETAELRAELSNRGGELVSLRLKKYVDGRGEAVELVRPRDGGPYPFGLLTATGEPDPLAQALFAVERREEQGEPVVEFRYRGERGSARKSFRFGRNGMIEAEVEVPGRSDWSLLLGPGLRSLTSEELTNRFSRRTASWQAAGKLETLAPEKAKESLAIPGTGLAWVALEDTYFLTALAPSGAEVAIFEPLLLEPGSSERIFSSRPLPPKSELKPEEKDLPRELRIRLQPASDRLTAHAYFGAKQYDRLSALGLGLERTVRWGTFGFLARPLLWGLQWIHDHLIANYGWAIVLLTLVLKILLLPLTHKATVSMQKMQELNPKIQGIRDRYRAKLRDKQGRYNAESQRKMNEEIMALYKTEGVNPAGGCLPMILQIPVLFAFYNLLSIAVELWRAPWLLWIHDLSAPDPYYVLPIVMGATQLIQQRMTPQAGDPMQRRIFQLMPIAFTVLFLGFPAGLVLYWLTNNVLTIVQQGVYNELKKRRGAALAAS